MAESFHYKNIPKQYIEIFGSQNSKCYAQRRGSKKVQVGKDQEKAQLEKDSHSKNRDGKKLN